MADNTDRALITIQVLIEGSPLDESHEITDIKVHKGVNQVAVAQLSLMDNSMLQKKKPQQRISNILTPGQDIEIRAGFGLKPQTIFKGIITAQNMRIGNGNTPEIRLECRDKAVKMTIGSKNRVFADKRDSDALTTLINDNGLDADVSNTSNTFPQIVQYYSTDWDFAIARAETNGMVVVNANNKITIRKPGSGSSVGKFTLGEDIVAIDLNMDASTQLGAVDAQAWDYKNQQNVQASAAAPSVPNQGNLSGEKLAKVTAPSSFQLQSTAPLTTEDLSTWADAQLLKSRLAKIRGTVKLFGKADFAPDTLIELDGVGSHFDGTAYVSAVDHLISDGEWWSTLEIGLDPSWYAKAHDISAAAAAGLLPGIRGMQNGVVKKITEDPAGENRIQVEVPMFSTADGPGLVWARWLQPYATSNAGQFFVPEIGDEVALGFLDADPRYPVILGSLYSSGRAPAYQPAEGNPIKAIVTRSLLTVEFNDEKKVTTISTPGGNKITLTDEDQGITIEDQNANKIELTPSGISLQSPSNININADGEVAISGTAGVTISSESTANISAEANLSISGLEVSISGEAAMSASGGGEMSLSADGEMSLSAAMIMIN